MSLRATVLTVLRHRIVVLVGFLATAAAVLMASSSVASTFTANATLVLLAPSEVASAEGTATINPYTRLGASGEGLVATTLASVSRSQKFEQSMEAAGVTGEYMVALAPDGGGVVMGTTVTESSPARAMAALTTLRGELDKELREQQEDVGAPPGSFLRLQVLVQDQEPVELTGSRTRAAAAVLMVGLSATVGAAILAERARPSAPQPAGAHRSPTPPRSSPPGPAIPRQEGPAFVVETPPGARRSRFRSATAQTPPGRS